MGPRQRVRVPYSSRIYARFWLCLTLLTATVGTVCILRVLLLWFPSEAEPLIALVCGLMFGLSQTERQRVLARGYAKGLLQRECIGCGYSLRGLPSARCPECGRAYDVEELRLGLARYLGFRRDLLAWEAEEREQDQSTR